MLVGDQVSSESFLRTLNDPHGAKLVCFVCVNHVAAGSRQVFIRSCSVEKATLWIILAGQLLLPVGTSFKFEMIPIFDKSSIPTFVFLSAACWQPDALGKTLEKIRSGSEALTVIYHARFRW